ncbi:carbon-nitrogen hydrolase family protein [Colwellia echini]|uniref:Carbon-nitrogen hydrolase n=1 Tax=Colwellia echini TaxID=1982103 RepID=A0ABY3N0N2_9GAMM|nr:carbon-nitrogen hydrolase family protein [Colwellia echini]TYK66926.1 carbon-nitrogen hydrolase [Colwellia echini]
MRVAVSQFASSANTQQNLANCLRIIAKTAECKPDIIVLPEYCNTLFCHFKPSYIDHNHAWQQALSIEGEFLQAIAEQALVHNCYIVINISLKRDLSRNITVSMAESNAKSNITVTSCLFSPLGKLIHQQDKQTLSGFEQKYFITGSEAAQVIPILQSHKKNTQLGLLSGQQSMNFHPARTLALAGAQLICNSYNTFTIDQSQLHDIAIASENNIFIATANKVGSLMNEEALATNLSGENIEEFLIGSGQSQIISPQGLVLAKLGGTEEGFTFADIDLTDNEAKSIVGINTKYRPDGTSIVNQRRPELYSVQAAVDGASTKANLQQSQCLNQESYDKASRVPTTANVAIFATYKPNEEAINDVCHYIENNLSDIIQLPELFFVTDKALTQDSAQRAEIARLCQQLISQVSAVLRPFQYLCTSVIINDTHQAIIISEQGVFASQQQLHFCQRYQWTALGDKLNLIALPLEQGTINVAMLTADDANIAELVSVAAINNAHLLLVPFDIQESIEVEFSLPARATENKVCIVAASREKSFANSVSVINAANDKNNIYSKNKLKEIKSTGLIINLTVESAVSRPNVSKASTLLPQWRSRKFNGYLNEPLVKHQFGKITKAIVHPVAAIKN